MSDFAPGDVVVCVPTDCGGHDDDPRPSLLTVGRYYTVEGITPYDPEWFTGCPCAVRIDEIPDPIGFCGARFRKLDKADEQFTETVRACKPIKHREPTHA